jgi:hypothetical protein
MKKNKPLLLLASGGMELSWRYAWATFLTSSILHHPFPFPEAVITFALAAVLTSVHHERGWRVILVVCIQMAGFIPSAWRIIDIFNSWSGGPFLSRAYQSFSGPFDQQGFPLEWVTMLLFLFWAFFFWVGGTGMARRPRDYGSICSRFDLGLGAFFLLFLVKFYLFLIGGKKGTDSPIELLLFSFFIFGLLAIGMARNRGREAKDFMPGYRGMGVILSFTALVLLFGGGLIFFAMPFLTGAAQIGFGILKTASVPVIYVITKVIAFLFGGEGTLRKSEKPPPNKTPTQSTPDLDFWWLKLIGEIMIWVVMILLALIFLTIFCVMAYSLVRWLFSKTSAERREQGLWDFLPAWVAGLLPFIRFWRRALGGKIKAYRGAVQFYAILLVWGRRSGLPRSSNETPFEYGSRLKYRFPVQEKDIESVVVAFNREVYGGMVLSDRQLAVTRFSLRRLRSPLLWFLRLKTRIRRPVERNGRFP